MKLENLLSRYRYNLKQKGNDTENHEQWEGKITSFALHDFKRSLFGFLNIFIMN